MVDIQGKSYDWAEAIVKHSRGRKLTAADLAFSYRAGFEDCIPAICEGLKDMLRDYVLGKDDEED